MIRKGRWRNRGEEERMLKRRDGEREMGGERDRNRERMEKRGRRRTGNRKG